MTPLGDDRDESSKDEWGSGKDGETYSELRNQVKIRPTPGLSCEGETVLAGVLKLLAWTLWSALLPVLRI